MRSTPLETQTKITTRPKHERSGCTSVDRGCASLVCYERRQMAGRIVKYGAKIELSKVASRKLTRVLGVRAVFWLFYAETKKWRRPLDRGRQ
jgi:hypothetical protein